MGRSDCRVCGHRHFNQGMGPCRSCFCEAFCGAHRISRAARRPVPANSHLERILERRARLPSLSRTQ